MKFIHAIVEISKRNDLHLCEDEDELDGIHPSICVYSKTGFIGKLRWPRNGEPASVDPEVTTILGKN